MSDKEISITYNPKTKMWISISKSVCSGPDFEHVMNIEAIRRELSEMEE